MAGCYPRDLVGYGKNPPNPNWPGGAKIALQFVINFEEGGENCVLHGDKRSETFLSDVTGAKSYKDRHLSMESLYEYGGRAGFWRLHRLFKEHSVPVTVFGVATALEKNPDAVRAMKEAEWEIASHGLRWINYQKFSREEERKHISKAIALHEKVTGSKPAGWYTGRTSPYTLELIAERKEIKYCADSYADDLPYWDRHYSEPLLVVPYALDTNDMRFVTPQGFNSGEQFFQYLKDAFDELYAEGSKSPKMMSIGLHCRLSGRPGRIAALRRFLEYTRRFDDVWYARRDEIASHWNKHYPANKEELVASKSELVADETSLISKSGQIKIQDPYVSDISSLNQDSVEGELTPYSVSVKDLFAIKGFRTGAGSPAWLKAATVETRNAEAVDRLLAHGARLTYKTQLDELAYSLAGNNVHYGISVNPADEKLCSGGSSSGAAVSVARGDVDLALATDTGGSVRIPAGYCGLYGMRPTHGYISVDGLVPLAPRFDTVGLIAGDLHAMELGMKALLGEQSVDQLNSMAWCESLWQGVEPELIEIARDCFDRFEGHKTLLDEPPLHREERVICFSVLQAESVWETHGEWLVQNMSSFAEDIQKRLSWGHSLSHHDLMQAHALYEEWSSMKSRWMPDGFVLLMPTMPGIAPALNTRPEETDRHREALLSLTSIAGLSGWPQLQIPVFRKGQAPLGLSLLSSSGMDMSLIHFAQHLFRHNDQR